LKTVTITEAKSSLEELIYELDGGLLIVESDDGHPLAVLTAVHEGEITDQAAKYPHRTLYEILSDANARIEEGGGIPSEEFWQLVDAGYPDKVADPA
jgi:antitoxin (DNA-binding transcriptional repressor) of toxin-antitoxin stability system